MTRVNRLVEATTRPWLRDVRAYKISEVIDERIEGYVGHASYVVTACVSADGLRTVEIKRGEHDSPMTPQGARALAKLLAEYAIEAEQMVPPERGFQDG